MVVGKLMHHQSAMSSSSCGTSNNCGYDGYEIRSGMSVQVRRNGESFWCRGALYSDTLLPWKCRTSSS